MACILYWRFLIVFLFIKFVKSEEDDPYNSTNARLIRDLLRRYQKHVRPVLHPADSITVSIYGAPYQIINVSWHDAYLKWTPSNYENAEYALLPASAVWTPEVFVYYSTDKKSVIESIINVKVNYTGHVQNFVPFTAETICPIDVKHFPFDKQHCTILFDTWPPNGDSVRLQLTGGGENLDVADFYDSQEWMLKNYSLLYDNSTHASGKTNVVAMHIHIERQSFYYIFNLVIPSALISIVSVVGFHLPAASTGGRYSKSRLGMMTLLSMSVLLLSVVNELPKFAFEAVPGKKGSFSSIPLIGIYYFSLLAIISLATITSSWIVVLEKQVIREGVPFYLRWLMMEDWPCWKNRCKQRPPSTIGKRGVEYKAASSKPGILTLTDRQGQGSADTLELADLYEDREASLTPPRAIKTVHANAAKGTNDRSRNLVAQRRDSQPEEQNPADIYKDIRSLMMEAVEVLKAMKRVLAEPVTQSIHPNAGIIVRRLEKFCLTVYLFLVLLVLFMFFCSSIWYG